MSESMSQNSQIPINNQEYRCPTCYLIPFIEVTIDQNVITMNTQCVNGHSFTDSFDNMKLSCKNNENYYCQLCINENNEIRNQNGQKFYYCSKCYNFYCINHGRKVHLLNDGHKIIFNDSYDNICFEHNGNTLVGYCVKDNKNYCLKCNHFAENNKKIDEELTDDQIKKYENEYAQNKRMIDEMEQLFNDYKRIFREFEDNYYLFRQNMYKRNEFLNELINVYKTKQKECSLIYQMKANIEINHFDLTEKKQIINAKINAQIKEFNELIKIFRSKEEPNK